MTLLRGLGYPPRTGGTEEQRTGGPTGASKDTRSQWDRREKDDEKMKYDQGRCQENVENQDKEPRTDGM